MTITTDILIIGSGVAGLTVALDVAKSAQVTVVTKRDRFESATSKAQGGIAVVMDAHDSPEAHARDTMIAGAGLCHEVVVDLCVREGPERLRELMRRGARFDSENGELKLGREGGHSERRVVHHTDATGAEVQRALLEAVENHPNIQLLEHHTAIDLIMLTRFGKPDRCIGAYVLDEKASSPDKHVVHAFASRETVLATGGAGKVYLYTSNPDIATGDGVAMAYRAGAEIGNMEFFQFHPTCLYHPKAKSFLVTEALRGEGAILRLPDDAGTAFMERHDERKDLAPRDIVARCIDFEMKRSGYDFVHLDITHKPADFLKSRFPTVYSRCMELGIDITCEPMPVVPAAHYMCGGITTDLKGCTSIPGLSAVGECAFTGLHGANRLASNSLLEGLVFGHRAAQRLRERVAEHKGAPYPDVLEWQTGGAVASDEAVVVAHNWDELRRTMWNYVGIVRSNSRLSRARRRIGMLEEEIVEYYWKHVVTRDLLELRNIAIVAQLLIDCASARKESRGLHDTIDYPDLDESVAADTIAKRGLPARMRELSGHPT